MGMRWTARKGVAAGLRLGAVALALVLAGLLVVWGIDLGRRIGSLGAAADGPDPKQQLALLQLELTKLQLERDQLAATAVNMVAQEQQTSQIKALQVENSKLKESLADFTSLLAAGRCAR